MFNCLVQLPVPYMPEPVVDTTFLACILLCSPALLCPALRVLNQNADTLSISSVPEVLRIESTHYYFLPFRPMPYRMLLRAALL